MLASLSTSERALKCTLQDYVKAVRSFKLKDAFPNMESHPYDWRVDKYEPQRVWFTIRNTATHTGPLPLCRRHLQSHWEGAPACQNQRLAVLCD